MSKFLLEAKNLRKTYTLGRVKVPVLRGASFTLAQGEWVAILGSSGSGKSTLLHLLGLLDECDADSGGVWFDGDPVADLKFSARNSYRNQSVGFVFQFYHLLPELSVLENALLPNMVNAGMSWWSKRAQAQKQATELLDAFGLSHRLTHRPAELSGGERQRVAIARALANQPRVLLADEPTAPLDGVRALAVIRLLNQLALQYQTAIIVVTHDETLAARCGRQLRLVQGKLTEDGR